MDFSSTIVRTRHDCLLKHSCVLKLYMIRVQWRTLGHGVHLYEVVLILTFLKVQDTCSGPQGVIYRDLIILLDISS